MSIEIRPKTGTVLGWLLRNSGRNTEGFARPTLYMKEDLVAVIYTPSPDSRAFVLYSENEFHALYPEHKRYLTFWVHPKAITKDLCGYDVEFILGSPLSLSSDYHCRACGENIPTQDGYCRDCVE